MISVCIQKYKFRGVFIMEKHKTCSFFGHRKAKCTDLIMKKVSEIVENLIIYCGVRVFLFGSRSAFDRLCHLVVTQLKEKYPEIKRVAYTCKSEMCILESEKGAWEKRFALLQRTNVVLLGVEEEFDHKTKYTAGKASYIERNQAMVNDSDYCVFYYDENYLPERRKYTRESAGEYQPNSGTALAYAYAKRKNKTLINVYQK